MTDKEKLERIKKALKEIIAYPKKGESRRTKDGYPKELVYDRFAYNRIVNSYRDALKHVISEFYKRGVKTNGR